MKIEQLAKALCRGEYTSFHLQLNDHKTNYVTATDALYQHGWLTEEDFVSPEEMQKALGTDTVWTLHWYPVTPVGSYLLHASSLEALLNAAEEYIGE